MFVVSVKNVEQLQREVEIAEGYRQVAQALHQQRAHARLLIDEMCARGALRDAQERAQDDHR